MMDKNDAIGVGRNPFDYDAFIRTDAAGLILQANDCAAEILTKSNESIIGRDLWEMIPSSISEKLREEIDRVSDEQIHAGIETYDARRGSWFEYHVCPTETGIVLLILDITARQRSIKEVESAHVGKEERLQQQIKIESEEKNRLKTLQDNLNMALKAAHMATWEFNPVAGVFLVSDGIQNVFGVPPEAAPQTPEEIHNWILPEDFPVHMDRIEKAVTSGEEYVSEFRVRNPQTGDIRWIDSRGRTLKDESGRPIKVYGIVQDITEKKRAHNELEARVEERTAELKTANRILHELEQRIAMVLKNAPIKMSMVDRDLRYTWIYHPLLQRRKICRENTRCFSAS
jgi:PAS domain S-box-containing protein